MISLLLYLVLCLIPLDGVYEASMGMSSKFMTLSDISFSKQSTILYYAPVLLVFIISILVGGKPRRNLNNYLKQVEGRNSTDGVFKLCRFAVLTIPLTLVSRDFCRLSLNLLVFAYSYFLSGDFYTIKIDKWKDGLKLKIALLSLVVIVYYCLNLHVSHGEYFGVIRHSFESNLMLNWLGEQF